MLKKIFSMMLIITMVFSISACTKKTSGGKADKVVNLVWITGGDQPKEYAETIKVLNEKSAKDIGVTVDIKYYDNEKALLAMSTGEYFDIAFTCEWYNNYAMGAQKGYFADITEKVKKSAPDLYKYIPDVVWNGSMIDNQLFAIPVYKDSAATEYWCFDEEFIIDQCGAEVENLSNNIEELTPILKAAKEKKPNEYPLMVNKDGFRVGTNYEYIIRDLFIGLPYDGNSTEVVSVFEAEDYLADLDTVHKWYDAGYINPDAPLIKEEQKYSAVWSGQGFVGADAIWSSIKDHKIKTVKRYGPIYSTASIRGSMNGISANSKHIDAALKYLQYANLNVEYRNMLAYGIEGKHYKKTEEGTIEKLNDGFNPWTFSQATFFTMYPTSPAPANQWELVKKDIQSAKGSPIIGFTPDFSVMETEIAASKSVIDKYKATILTGAGDPRVEIPKMLDELKGTGYYDIIEKIQEQVNAFKK